MPETMDMPTETLDRRPEPPPSDTEISPEPSPPLPPPPPTTTDMDSKERDGPEDRRDSRDQTPPLPPPPPLPPSRDTDPVRRRSPSPPPYRDRRRRRSPPRRSPPGPSKRYRRDDGYDRRRGSPRGGYGSDDRRYDYDRGGERNHGRYRNRSSDWTDSGRGGYGDGSATEREGLMSYKQFIQELEDDILPSEAERRYSEYRSEYISTQKHAYFELHKDEEWLKDKYHPTHLLTVIERRNEHARAAAKDFLRDLQSGTLELGPGMSSPLSKYGHDSEPNSEDETGAGGKRRRHVRGPAKETDMLSAAPKAHPVSADPRRILLDIQQAQALVRKVDAEKGIRENILCGSDHDKSEGEKSHGGPMGPIVILRGLNIVKGLEGLELLETLITYLFRIHGVDYYGMTETNDAKGFRHVIAECKPNDQSNIGGADWEKKLDLVWQERLLGLDPLEKMTAKEKIDEAAVEVLDPLVRKKRDEKYGWKYGCGAKNCTKLFHAAEFVHKHLRLKHPELVMELTVKLREDLYFQNYMNDANAPGGTPFMQKSIPSVASKCRYRISRNNKSLEFCHVYSKDRATRLRPILENRLRDDRGTRRGHDRNGRAVDEDGNDRADSPARHNGGPDPGNPDEPMDDAHSGQGFHGAHSYPPPPQVLMPVPGAGPLGPFVPAPPEVARKMLQGGPSTFEGDGGSCNGKGRTGLGPILGIPSTFRPDPRRIRSYQDLDAPEDEVTVIDYRSI